jgi:hypothetical protein
MENQTLFSSDYSSPAIFLWTHSNYTASGSVGESSASVVCLDRIAYGCILSFEKVNGRDHHIAVTSLAYGLPECAFTEHSLTGRSCSDKI